MNDKATNSNIKAFFFHELFVHFLKKKKLSMKAIKDKIRVRASKTKISTYKTRNNIK